MYQLAFRFVQITWRKCRPDHLKKQDDFLQDITYNLLLAEKYKLAQPVLDFAVGIRGESPENTRRALCINRAIAYKLDGQEDQVKSILKAFDWSASSPKYKLAIKVLTGDFSDALAMIPHIPTKGEDGVDEDNYREWPLFKYLREDAAFAEVFEAKFGEPLQQVSGFGEIIDGFGHERGRDGVAVFCRSSVPAPRRRDKTLQRNHLQGGDQPPRGVAERTGLRFHQTE